MGAYKTGHMIVKLADLIRDQRLQSRANGTDDALVSEYAEAMKAGDEFPPVKAVRDIHRRGQFYLYDGFHTVAAAERAGKTQIRVTVKRGGFERAVELAAGANARHGQRRAKADQEHAVRMLLAQPTWARRSTSWIARTARVSDHLAERVRNEFDPKWREKGNIVGRDGKERPAGSGSKTAASVGKSTPQLGGSPTGPRQREPGEDDYELVPGPDGKPVPQIVDPPADPSAPVAKPKPAAAEAGDAPVRDSLGNIVPAPLRDMFGDPFFVETLAQVDQALSLLNFDRAIRALKGGLAERLAYVQAGAFAAAVEAAVKEVKAARSALEAGKPYAVCPACQGKGCIECRRGGYMPQWRYEEYTRDRGAAA